MPLSLRPLPSLLLFALLGAGTIAVAGPRQDPSAPQASAQQRQRPERPAFERPAPRHEDALSDSVRRIERSTRGQVLSAERVPYDGRNLNRIKVVDERGRVRVYMDDPARSDGGRSDGRRSDGRRSDSQPTAVPPTRGDDD